MVPLSLLVRNKSALRARPQKHGKSCLCYCTALVQPRHSENSSAFETPVTAPLQRSKTTTKGGNFVKLFRGFYPTARLFRARPSPAGRDEVLTLSGKRFLSVKGRNHLRQPTPCSISHDFFRGPLDLGRLIPWQRRRVNSDMLYRLIIVAANLPRTSARTPDLPSLCDFRS